MSLSIEVNLSPQAVLSASTLASIKVSTEKLLEETIRKVDLEAGVLEPSSSSGFSSMFKSSSILLSNVEQIRITDFPTGKTNLSFWDWKEIMLNIYIFQMNDDEPETDDAGDEEGTHQVLLLPNTRVEGLWESLILEDGVKSLLLDYSTAALRFSDVGVDENIISWNRVVLLHGPPGTGKTSLCKALAHKLAIRLSSRYSSTQLLEINAHSLFSKWFSESGKKVMCLFEHIQECCQDEDSLVCVLVDEVESLTSARQNAIGNGEPGDALRVVNAMLTGKK